MQKFFFALCTSLQRAPGKLDLSAYHSLKEHAVNTTKAYNNSEGKLDLSRHSRLLYSRPNNSIPRLVCCDLLSLGLLAVTAETAPSDYFRRMTLFN